MTPFQELKAAIVAGTGLSKDALHIYVGFIVLLAAASLLRKPLHSAQPLLAVLLAAILLEVGDLRDDLMISGRWRWGASLHDIVNTMFWPSVLALISRRVKSSDRSNQRLSDESRGDSSGRKL